MLCNSRAQLTEVVRMYKLICFVCEFLCLVVKFDDDRLFVVQLRPVKVEVQGHLSLSDHQKVLDAVLRLHTTGLAFEPKTRRW